MTVESILAAFLIGYILFSIVRIYIFRKASDGLWTGFASMVSIALGMFLWISNGLILDYGNRYEIESSSAHLMIVLGIICVYAGTLFVLISVVKFLIHSIRNNYNH